MSNISLLDTALSNPREANVYAITIYILYITILSTDDDNRVVLLGMRNASCKTDYINASYISVSLLKCYR